MTAITHGTVRTNGIRQHYVEAGARPPVVLLHGFPETILAERPAKVNRLLLKFLEGWRG